MTNTPAEYALFSTPIGRCGIAWTDAGIARVALPEASEDATRARLESLPPRPTPSKRARAPRTIREAMRIIAAHLVGEADSMTGFALDLSGVPAFHAKVYVALRDVAPGQTVTYAELARRAGSPAAVRAVGQAMAKNPIPIVVPCHRVLGADGTPGGFSAHGGTVTKASILAAEGVILGARTRARSTRAAGSESLFDARRSENLLPYDAAKALKHLAANDPKLGALIEKIGPFALRLKETEGAFAALAESIVYQQLNGKAAATILGRVKALVARGVLTPKAVLAASDDELRGAGLSRSKLLALRDLATKTEEGLVPPLPTLLTMTDDEIVERLTQIRGIGRWTVEMLLMFRLGRPDVLPVTDYGVRQGFKTAFRTRALPSSEVMLRRAERWRPFRSVAAWYLWRVLELGRDT